MPTPALVPLNTINGTILDTFNKPVINVLVKVFDQDLRIPQLLGETRTNPQGFYSIIYNAQIAAASEYKTADLFIEVFDSTGKSAGKSDIVFNAGPVTTINLTITATDEFTGLVAIINPLLASSNLQIKNLEENDNNQDISFLSKETGISSEKIGFLVKAFQLADEAGKIKTTAGTLPTNNSTSVNIPPAIFYALLQSGLPNNLSALLRTPTANLQTILKNAVDENIISKTFAPEFDSIIKLFLALLAGSVINSNEAANVKFKNTAGIVKLSAKAINKIAEKVQDIDDADDDFLEKLQEDQLITAAQKSGLKFSIDLSRLSGENIDLVKSLYNDSSSIEDFIDYNTEDWKKLLTDKHISVPDEEKSVDTYSASLTKNMEISFPQTFFLNRIVAKKDFTVSLKTFDAVAKIDALGGLVYKENKILTDNINWTGVSPEEKKNLEAEIAQLTEFSNTYRYLGITETLAKQEIDITAKKEIINKRLNQLKTFYASNAQIDFAQLDFFNPEIKLNYSGVDENIRPLIKAQAMAYQRMLILGENTKTAQALLAKGFSSSKDIIDVGEERFVQIAGLELNEAKQVFTTAQDKVTATSHFFQAIRDAQKGGFNSLKVNNLLPIVNDLRQIDGYDQLFGSQNFCDCEHCRSIFSPAAYFTDLMLFVEKKVTQKVFSGVKADHPLNLKKRRPDLWKLPLTCQNTTTAIPYLDVVNNVLEEYILTNMGISDVYRELSESEISFNLPFNLQLDELRTYLGHFGLSLSQIYELLNMDPFKLAQEKLRLSNKELEIIVSPSSEKTFIKFGSPKDSNGLQDLNKITVSEFMRLANISRAELDELLSVAFLPGISTIKIEPNETEDDIQQYHEHFKKDSLTLKSLDHIQRFLKLWHKTPWTISEFGMLLQAMKNAKLFSQLVDKDSHGNYKMLVIADVIELQKNLKLTVEELYAIIDEIPEFSLLSGGMGLYERLFNLQEIFGIDPVTNDKVIPYLIAGLSVSETDLNLLLGLLGENTASISLDKHLISRLYRQSRLASGLKISIVEYIAAVKIFLENTEARNIGDAVQLVAGKKWINSTPFNFQQLDFIINGTENAVNKFIYNTEKVKLLVVEIQTAILVSGTVAVDILKNKIQGIFNISKAQLKEDYLKITSIKIDDPLITAALQSSLVNLSDLDPLISFLNDLERKIFCFNKLKWSEKDISLFANHFSVFAVTDAGNWSLDGLKAMIIYSNLFKNVEEDTKEKIRAIVEMNNSVITFTEEDISLLSTLWSCSPSVIHSVIDAIPFNGSLITDINKLKELIGTYSVLGIQADKLFKLKETDYAGVTEAKNIVYGSFASKYADEQTRTDKLASYHDKMNTLKRDALCDYIISQRDKYKFNDRSELYYFFLLDVEMSGCFRTSKLLAAISSVQLYIHRCLLNLEQSDTVLNPAIVNISVAPGLIPVDEWEWRKNYRVWEANRKVFLYPENYIDPALRNNATPLFKELADELLQQNITQDTAEAAYKKYLAQFLELANLRYAGAYYHYAENKPVTQVETPVTSSINSPINTMRVVNMSVGQIAVFANPFVDKDKTVYYFFARTHLQPYQYYYRTFNAFKNLWGHWEKIDLPIEAEEVSTIIHNGKLHIYWTEVQHKEVTKIADAQATSDNVIFKVTTKYSHLDANGRWAPPQRLYLGSDITKESNIYYRLNTGFDAEKVNIDSLIDLYKLKVFGKPYVSTLPSSEELEIRHIYTVRLNIQSNTYKTKEREVLLGGPWDLRRVNIPSYTFQVENGKFDAVEEQPTGIENYPGSVKMVELNRVVIKFTQYTWFNLIPELTSQLEPIQIASYTQNVNNYIKDPNRSFIDDAHPIYSDIDISKEFLYSYNEVGDYIHFVEDGNKNFITGNRVISQFKKGSADLTFDIRNIQGITELSTILSDELSITLSEKGLQTFLSLQTQNWSNCAGQKLNFSGPYGAYYWEMFFHIPFLIASHLNANQDFKGAKWWLERIFNPTSSEKSDTANPGEHYWQFREFRNLDITRLKEILADESTIAIYKRDPFDPHAIAALRISSYQKAIVMKYIDNLLDWGDSLFTQDTQESIVEADMLYQLAQDILGKRPVKTGKCKTADENDLTFESVIGTLNNGSEFLVTLENVYEGVKSRVTNDKAVLENSKYLSKLMENLGETDATPNTLSGWAALSNAHYMSDLHNAENESTTVVSTFKPRVVKYATAMAMNYVPKQYLQKTFSDFNDQGNKVIYNYERTIPAKELTDQSLLAFCVPVNDYLLQYWDMVEDRLFKIRNCMNISGIRRSLALYQPPIDPMLLIRAKAAGLSLEDISAIGTGAIPLPNYRFVYMLEKAKQFAQTVQGFGGALLSALEKKDGEELTLLRSVHERNILRLTKDIKSKQLLEAHKQYISLEESITNIENRIEYYEGLIEEGLTGWEITQQITKHSATIIQNTSTAFYGSSSIAALLPQLGSPFSLNWGGEQVSKNSENWGKFLSANASILESVSASAGLNAGFNRRKEEWNFQLLTAAQELKQATQQLLAADLRIKIAERDQEIHEKTIEQSDEVHEFLQDKFTNLALYNYMASKLNRLYLQSYQLAYEVAQQAEQCYKTETFDEDAVFIENDNWQNDMAGLLSGERLMLQLQRMEKTFMNRNTRQKEITQSFSLAQINPAALLRLRQTGSFGDDSVPLSGVSILEIAFDLLYPGQYQRVIKSVRISIPCIAGPYTNVSAKLTLKNSKVRKRDINIDSPFTTVIEERTYAKDTSITTSSSQNDGGVFELNFRDERYLPFEGAGAISTWQLELPGVMRSFNYDTISDVIFHISYTAKDDAAFRTSVEDNLRSRFMEAASEGLPLLLSLKHEFPDEFHKLLNSIDENVEFDLTSDYFPYFLVDKTLSITDTKVYLKPKRGMEVTVPESMKINDGVPVVPIPDFDIATEGSISEIDKIKAGTVSLSGSPLKKWKIDAGNNGIDKESTEDILILIKYKIE